MIIREVLNGVSMVVPLAAMALKAPATRYGRAALIGTALHAPVSCGYHLMCAAKLNPDPANCVGRKLDQTFIHVAAAMITYATSHSIQYTAAAAAMNTRHIRLLWTAGPHDTPKARRLRIAMAYIVYLLPVFLNNVHMGARILLSLLVSCAAFIFDKRLKGVGHTVFHLGFGASCYQLAKVI
jgi:hypothetical protein